jgi:hypothetical protein
VVGVGEVEEEGEEDEEEGEASRRWVRDETKVNNGKHLKD